MSDHDPPPPRSLLARLALAYAPAVAMILAIVRELVTKR